MEQMMERLVAKMDSNQEEMKDGQEQMRDEMETI
jgi:hypothetical protein